MLRGIGKILLGLVALLLLVVIFLVGSVVVDTLTGAERINAVTNTVIPGKDGGPDVRAYVARPGGSEPVAAVIMIHEFYGLNESIVGKAEGLAEEGYLVVAPDTFRGSTTGWIPRAIYQVISTKAEQVNEDLDSVVAWLQTQPGVDAERIAVLGFCYGGRASLTYSLHNADLAATVVFYGQPETDPAVLRALPGPVLGIFGGADTSIPVEDVRAFEAGLEQAGVPHEISIYDGQPHAFVSDMGAIRAGGAQQQAWQQMLRFLEENLKTTAGQEGQPPALTYSQPFAWRYYLGLVYEHAFGMSHAHGLR